MASKFQRPKGRDDALSALDVVIKGLDLAKDACGIPPAQAVFGTVSALLTMIRVRPITSSDDELLVHVCSGLDGQ